MYKKGFTLVELLIVVLIIGILSAVALPNYRRAIEKARLAEGLIIAKAISNAIQRYRQANPNKSGPCTRLDIADLDLKGGSWYTGTYSLSGTNCDCFATDHFVYDLGFSSGKFVDVWRINNAKSAAQNSTYNDNYLYNFWYDTEHSASQNCSSDDSKLGDFMCNFITQSL